MRRPPGTGPVGWRDAGWHGVAIPALVGLLVAVGALALLDAAQVADPDEQPPAPARDAGAPGASPSGRAVFARMGCGNCHAFGAGNSTAEHGAPNLDRAVAGHTRRSLREKSLHPYGRTPPDSFTVMPTDFGSRMSEGELDALVDFLLDER